MAHSWSFGKDVSPDSRSGITDADGTLSQGSLFGPFEILGSLGEGSSGRVYRARAPRGEVFALKIIKGRLDAGRRERFLREGAVLAQLAHPGIVRVLSGGEVEGIPFLACELVEAPKEFREVLGEATLRARVQMVRDLADAVGYAHARGVVHRDLKPENVLVDSQGRTRLADLGLALAGGVERLTRTGEVLGTPLYMAPEQTEAGAPSGPPVDVWALGVMLYEALSGRLPFSAHGWLELRALIRKATPTPLGQLVPSLPTPLRTLCHRALSRAPADRFPNGVAFARALDAALATLPDHAGPALAVRAPQGAPLRTPIGLGRHGRFEVLEELGRGGMGVVYRALDTELGREIALKVILADRGNAKRLGRFQREGELTATLSHPGILKVHSMGVIDETPYIVYELIEGARTLDDVLPTLERRAGLELVRDAARALGHAHEHGVVHRDVKPDNLLLDREGRILVADFGLAAGRNVERLTRTGAIVGTPQYMAPEQAAGERKKIGPHTDVWGLGVVLYRLLCGCYPFEAASFIELCAAIVGNHPVAPRAHDPTIAKDLEAICLTALNRTPAGRYPDGGAFADDLDAFFEGRSPTASGSRAFLPRLKAKRSTLLAIPLVAAALVVLGVLVQPALKKRLPTDVAAVDSKTSVVTHRRQPGAQTAAGQAAWRDVEALDDPDQQKARVKKWLKTYKGHPRVPDALRLAEALRFAVPRRQIIFTHVEGSPRAHAYGVFLGDDQLLTYGDDDVVKRWNAKTGALAAKRTYRNMEEIRSLVPFGDAGRFVAGHPIYLLVASLRDTYQSRIQARLAARLAVSPDGRRVVAPGVDRVVEYDLETQAELRRYSIAVSATAAAYSPSGERLVVFTGDKGKDSAGNEIYIWNTVDGEQVARERVSGLVRSIAYTQDGKTLFVGTSTGVLAELDAETGRGLGTLQSDELYRKARGMGLTAHRGSVKGLAFSHDYEVLYTVSQGAMEWSCELRLWDMKTRSPLRPPILRPYKLDGIAFSPDGTHFCLATEAGVVEVWSRE